MANPFFGLYPPYTNPQYPPWMYQRSYPFPGFRQTGACPQHGAFYGHGACFQLPHNQPAAASPGIFGNPPAHVSPAATGLGPSAQHGPVSTGMNAISRSSPANVLSAKAETFVPISTQSTISSVGGSDIASLRNPDIGQRFFLHKDIQPGHDLSALPKAPRKHEIGQNKPVAPSISATVETGKGLTARHDAPTPTEPDLGLTARYNFRAPTEPKIGLNTRHDISAPVKPSLDLNAHHGISAPVESGLGPIIRRTTSASVEDGRNPTVPSNPLTQNLSPVAGSERNFQLPHQSLFPYADQERTNVKFLVAFRESNHLQIVLLIIVYTSKY